jgi:hypothetical protein
MSKMRRFGFLHNNLFFLYRNDKLSLDIKTKRMVSSQEDQTTLLEKRKRSQEKRRT